MTDLSPDQKHGPWASARRLIVAVLTWSPRFSPKTARWVKWGAIGAFSVDFALLVALHNHWLEGGWHTVRQWEDFGALALMTLWISQVTRAWKDRRDSGRDRRDRALT